MYLPGETAAKRKTLSFLPEFPSTVLELSGGATGVIDLQHDDPTHANLYQMRNTIAAGPETGTVHFSLPVPQDFRLWSASLASFLQLDIETSTVVAATSRVDVAVFDSNGDAATLTNATGLVNAIAATRETYTIGIAGGVFTPGAGFTIDIDLVADNETVELYSMTLDYQRV